MGAGKSYICSGNIVKNAQEQGIFVILVDTENALDETWLHALGVDTGADKLLKLNMSMIDDVAKAISTFMIDYKALPDGERMKKWKTFLVRPKYFYQFSKIGLKTIQDLKYIG